VHADIRRFVHDFDAPPPLPAAELKRLLGGKGANLVEMANELGLPVPPGFTVTTEACAAYLGGDWPAGLDGELRAHMDRLGARVGRGFGDALDPLLVSVRSGAPVSMPGMMDTILNLGLNDALADGLAAVTTDADFAQDCLRRFRQGYRDVLGVEEVPDDPWLQLRTAIEAVFRSWNSERAVAYRGREGIPDDLGTAVTVQAMVFGNRGADSGTGVLFTRNPSTGEPDLYGDVMFDAQGEDVVAGGHEPQPLAVLHERLPAVAAELDRYAGVLERHHADLCDIEFTIEQGRLWLLQVRAGKRSPRAALRIAIDMAEDEPFPLSRVEAVRRVAAQLADPPRIFVRSADAPEPIAKGLPASPGVATGAIVTSSDAAEAAAESGTPVILVRPETSPEDVRGMARSAGVLTARGGLASHAAVVARGWGIPAVVGAAGVRPTADAVEIYGRTLKVGDQLTIDGGTGEIFAGELAGDWEVVPEAATLLAWAADEGIRIAAPDTAPPPPEIEEAGAKATQGSQAIDLSAEDLARALSIKGTATLSQLSDALLVGTDRVEPMVEMLAQDGLAEKAGDQIRLSGRGKLAATEAFDADRSAIGEQRAGEVLESFHAFDARMKAIVTTWQVRDVGGEQVLNDHSDPAYDAGLLDDLAALHAETAVWLSPLAAELRRFDTYRSRLTQAVDLARRGDQRYVASPRVDSYHTVWFELHEDLIRLAGRRRSDEAAAGRA
jgi:pyruvate,orthophosphate dikinase